MMGRRGRKKKKRRFFFFQAEEGIRDAQESRGLGDVYRRRNMFGDALRDLLDPRMRGGTGRYMARVKRSIGV